MSLKLLVHLLFPHESNNHKAKLLQPSGLVVLALLFLSFQLVLRFFAVSGPQVLGFAANISPDEVIRLTNEKRAQNGLAPLVHNPSLSQAAQAKAADMMNKDYWAHVAPDGTQPWKFFSDVGYRYKYAGENLARDFSNPVSAVDAWMASQSHKENMLSPKYKEIGVAVIDGDMNGVDTTIVVQLFGTRLGDTLPIQPVAASVESTQATAPPTANSVPTKVPVIAISEVSNTPLPATTVLVSPFNVNKNISIAIVTVLLVALVIDILIISKRRIHRVSSRTFAHIAFIGMVLAIIIIARAGRIL